MCETCPKKGVTQGLPRPPSGTVIAEMLAFALSSNNHSSLHYSFASTTPSYTSLIPPGHESYSGRLHNKICSFMSRSCPPVRSLTRWPDCHSVHRVHSTSMFSIFRVMRFSPVIAQSSEQHRHVASQGRDSVAQQEEVVTIG